MATHFSTLDWKIPWTEDLHRLQSMGLQGVAHEWATSLLMTGSLPLLAVRSPDSTFHLLRVKTDLAIHIHRALSTAVYTPQTVQCLYTRSVFAAAAAKSLQLCPTLCDPIDGSSPGSPVPGTLQARTLEWVAISFSNA